MSPYQIKLKVKLCGRDGIALVERTIASATRPDRNSEWTLPDRRMPRQATTFSEVAHRRFEVTFRVEYRDQDTDDLVFVFMDAGFSEILTAVSDG